MYSVKLSGGSDALSVHSLLQCVCDLCELFCISGVFLLQCVCNLCELFCIRGVCLFIAVCLRFV